jgi:hypothetical protein
MGWRKVTKPEDDPSRLPDLPPMPVPKPVQAIKQEPEQKEVYEVVAKLPVQEIRRYRRDDGIIVNLITIEEALTEVMNAGA